jgi:hypothetical protein
MRPHYAALTHAGKYPPVLTRCVILASIRRAIVAGAGMLGGTPTRQVQKVWGWLRPCRRDKSTIAASPRQRQFAAHELQISCCSRKPLYPARPFLGTRRRHQFTNAFPPTPLEPIGPSKLLRDMVWGLGRFRHIWPYTFLIAGALATVAWTAFLGYALVTLVLTAL